ncbi:winged helix-turn-helix transcriptional regulator [Candidatus Woesearchaeota archaeon]|nr:winged helix-turn-helix transcriptional regulator [Candidatus Woesearchaeota archaeon]
MIKDIQKITIAKIRKPRDLDLNAELQWFSQSFGLFGERDKEKSCFRIFVELIKAARKGKGLTSDELAARSNISRATVIHHLKKLISSGLILNEGNHYLLRTQTLHELTEELQQDLRRMLNDLEKAAEELDEQLGLNSGKQRVKVISD